MTEESVESPFSQTLEGFRKPGILDNFLKPNTQFIQQAKQMKKLANVVLEIFEKFRDEQKVSKLRSASTRTGGGFLINTEEIDINNLNKDDFIEVIDFDPVRNNLMVIGNSAPTSDASIHWFIYRGLPEVNGVIIVENEEILTAFEKSSFPMIANEASILYLDFALDILKSAKDSRITLMNGRSIRGILIIGRTLPEVYDYYITNQEKYSSTKKQKDK